MLFLVTNFIATAGQAQGTCPEVSARRWGDCGAGGAAARSLALSDPHGHGFVQCNQNHLWKDKGHALLELTSSLGFLSRGGTAWSLQASCCL